MDATFAARALATSRIAVGLGLFLAPRRAGAIWIGSEADGRYVTAMIRGLAARDVAIGVGTLVALRDGPTEDAERWLEAGIVADLADAAGTLLTGSPDRDRAMVLVVAGGAAIAGALSRMRLR